MTELVFDEEDAHEFYAAIQRVRELAEKLQNKEAFHQLTAWACAEEILKALNVDTDTLERDDDHDSRRDDYQEEDLG